MKSFLKLIPVAAVALGMTAGATEAATLVLDGSKLAGATGVDVEGTLYDVIFSQDSCAALYAGCDAVEDFAFQSEGSAGAASQALLDQVFLGAFDDDPGLTINVTWSIINQVYTPYAFGGGGVRVAGAINRPTFGASRGADDVIFTVFNGSALTGTPSSNYASWSVSPAMSAVPLPASSLLLLAGLGGLAALRKRTSKA
jgi:hypothetical protein